MASLENEEALEAQVRQIMEKLAVSRDAARLYLTIQSGNAFVNDRISLGPDEQLDPELEADLARWRQERVAGRTA